MLLREWKTNAQFAYFWLLLQYQPILFLGDDVFRHVFQMVVECNSDEVSSNLGVKLEHYSYSVTKLMLVAFHRLLF